MKKVFLSLFLIIFLILAVKANLVLAQQNYICAVYFTGIGCSHCAKTDPIILEKLPKENLNLVIIEYEIYQQRENASVFYQYCENYNIPLKERGIPFILFDNNIYIVGDTSILRDVEKIIKAKKSNRCALINGTSLAFEDLDLDSLPGSPKVWHKPAELPLKEIPLEAKIAPEEFQQSEDAQEVKSNLGLAKILSLALVDAVNPCALAVLTLMLIAILTYNPTKKRNILWAGLAFVISVFIMYFIYGLIIICSFQIIQALSSIRLWLYKVLGLGAIILGCSKIKDFFQPKGVCKVSPRVDRIISKVTSPRGAFLAGAFVTIFLLPCTIGPYIICGGILSSLEMLNSLPWLFLYNLIFVLPMLVVVLIIYLGLGKIEDIPGWQARNIKYLDLFSGLIILGLGICMFLGLV